ncbi:hypothetical protein LXL04_004032 [Taraxacum kok-saghyz]
MVKRIRGIGFSTRVSVQFENTMIHAAKGIFNRLLPDVHIFTDHKAGAQAGNSPGYGISLVAETIPGCYISMDTTNSYRKWDGVNAMDADKKKELMPPGEVGEQIVSLLLGKIEAKAHGGESIQFPKPTTSKIEWEYHHWSIQMKVLFQSQELWDVMEEEIEEPDVMDEVSEDQETVIQSLNWKDRKALYLIYKSVDKVIFERIFSSNSAFEAWNMLYYKHEFCL